jgi:hypothetical protein
MVLEAEPVEVAIRLPARGTSTLLNLRLVDKEHLRPRLLLVCEHTDDTLDSLHPIDLDHLWSRNRPLIPITIRPMPRIRRPTQRHRMRRITDHRLIHQAVDNMILIMGMVDRSEEASIVTTLHTAVAHITKDTTMNGVITILPLIHIRSTRPIRHIRTDIRLAVEVTTILILRTLVTMAVILAPMMNTSDTIITTAILTMGMVQRRMKSLA